MANLRLAPGRRALSRFCGIGFFMRDGLHVLPRTLEHGFGRVAGQRHLQWRRREIAFPPAIPCHRWPAFGRCGHPPREVSRRYSLSGSPGTDHRSRAQHGQFSTLRARARCATRRSMQGAASAPKFGRKTSKPCSLVAKVPGDPFGAVAPEDDPFVKVEHADSDLQALQKPSTDLGILKRQTFVDRQRGSRISPSAQSTAKSGNEPCCALRKTRK
jgi:hypothetical protein